EDALIVDHDGLDAASVELALREIPVLTGLSDAELALIALRLRHARYKPGEIVIRQGDRDRSVYIVASGTTTVRVNAAGSERQVRLASYPRGTMFGGMAPPPPHPPSAPPLPHNPP